MLINCAAYQEGRKLGDIDVEDINEYLKRPGCFVWVALRDATQTELDKMREEFDLHELAVEDAKNGHQRPKIEEYGETVFVVIQTVEFTPTDELQVGEVDVFVGPNFVLSVRNRSQHSLLDVRARAEKEPQLLSHGSGFVLYALMDAVVDRYFPVIEALEAELEAIEHQIFDRDAGRANVERLYALKGRITLVKHAVSPLMEATGGLVGGRVPRVCANSREYFRDVYDHLTRINAALDSLRDTIGTAVQVNLSVVTIEETETTKRLAAWAGIFAVATAFVGIWGMNFEFMPELKWKYGYALALGLVAVTCSLLYRHFRKMRWL